MIGVVPVPDTDHMETGGRNSSLPHSIHYALQFRINTGYYILAFVSEVLVSLI